jgi:hypothetical protein
MINSAPSFGGKPNLNAASTACTIGSSIISSAAGTIPAAMMAPTDCEQASTES